jgi:coenzyme F420-reducing hydrogenase alpha subunit
MKKLSKTQDQERTRLADELQEKHEALEQAVDQFNQTLTEAREKLETVIGEYNAALEETRAFVEEIASDMETYYDERSEKWQEGDAGTNYSDWKDQWDINEFNDVEIEFPDDLNFDVEEHGTKLADLPSEPGESW